jgi:TRAP-type C4-dicarboxylate transport system permease small subunit
MSGLARAYDRIIDGLAIVAAFGIALITALVCADVLLRNAGLPTIPWQLEISEYAQYAVTFLGAPWVLRLGGHVRVDMMINLVGPARAFVLEFVADLFGLFASLVLFGYGLYTVYLTWRDNQLQIKMLVVPEWIIFSVVVFSGLLLATEFIRRLRRERTRKRDSATIQI